MTPYFQSMKLISSSWLRPRTILGQTYTVTLGAPRVNYTLPQTLGQVPVQAVNYVQEVG